MRRIPSLVAAGVMGVATLSACGGGDGSQFCDDFRDNAETNEFDNLGADDVDKVKDEIEKFKANAPDELKDDYDVLLGAVDGNEDDAANLDESLTNIQDYAVDNCDVEVDNGS